MEAIAKYDFKATAEDELSFKRGEILKVTASCFLLCQGLLIQSSHSFTGRALIYVRLFVCVINALIHVLFSCSLTSCVVLALFN